MLASGVVVPLAFGQGHTRTETAEQFRRMSENYEEKGLTEQFRGITTNGTVQPNLFEIAPTGVSTEPVRNTAEKFLGSLTSVQLTRVMYPGR